MTWVDLTRKNKRRPLPVVVPNKDIAEAAMAAKVFTLSTSTAEPNPETNPEPDMMTPCSTPTKEGLVADECSYSPTHVKREPGASRPRDLGQLQPNRRSADYRSMSAANLPS